MTSVQGVAGSILLASDNTLRVGGDVNHVVFPDQAADQAVDPLPCFLENAQHVQDALPFFRTAAINNDGTTLATPFDNHHTYRIYQADEVPRRNLVAVGRIPTPPFEVRLESVRVDQLRPAHVRGTSLTYYEAVLLELYREVTGKDSLQGTCVHEGRSCERLRDGEDAVKTLEDDLPLLQLTENSEN